MNITTSYGVLPTGVITGLIFTGIVLLGIAIANRLLDEGWPSTLASWVFLLVGFIVSMYALFSMFQAPEFSSSVGDENRRTAFYVFFCLGPLLTSVVLIAQKRFRRP